MQVQIYTDSNIEGQETMIGRIRVRVKSCMLRFRDHISRVEVHLSDEIGDKKGLGDKSCMMEARIAGRSPVAVTHHASTLDEAVVLALDKLTNLVANTIEKKRGKKHYRTNSLMPKGSIVPVLSVVVLIATACSNTKTDNTEGALSQSAIEKEDFDKAATKFKFAADAYTFEKRALFLQEMTNALKETRSDLEVLSSKTIDLIGMTRIEARRKLRELTDRTSNLETRNKAAMNVQEPSWTTTRDGLSDAFTDLMRAFNKFRRSMS